MPDIYGLNNFYTDLQAKSLRLAYQFQITMPGLTNLQFYAGSTQLPSNKVSSNEVKFFGIPLSLPGVVVPGGELPLSVRCDKDMVIHKQLLDLQNSYSDVKKSGGGNKKIPAVKARLDLLDETLQSIVDTIICEGAWLSDVPGSTLKHDGTEIVTFDCKLQFQYWYYEKLGDPLK